MTELSLCQRYYYTDNATNSFVVASAYYTPYFFKVAMRSAPTVAFTVNAGTATAVNVGIQNFFVLGSGAASAASVTASAEL